MRAVSVVGSAALFAVVATNASAGCTHGNYDGSFDGSFDGGTTLEGSTATRVVQPDKTETFATSDGVFDVTFGPGTFAQPATITITAGGEQTLDIGLIVPIFAVSADQPPMKLFQVSFHGSNTVGGGLQNRALVPALSTTGLFQGLPIAGTSAVGGPTQVFWGLTKTFGTYSLALVTEPQSGGFADNPTSCTGQCCHLMNNAEIVGFAGGCFCSSAPDLACFLEHCSDLTAAAARCTAIAASNTVGSVSCAPFGTANCPGPGCMGSFPGMCGVGGGGGGGGGGVNNTNTCCILNRSTGTCATSSCAGFAARCTATTPCPVGTKCCVFASESYCAADCPEAQRACASNADCADAGADAGTCQGGGCPVAVCGTPPEACR
jgi:hypothetical protein